MKRMIWALVCLFIYRFMLSADNQQTTYSSAISKKIPIYKEKDIKYPLLGSISFDKEISLENLTWHPDSTQIACLSSLQDEEIKESIIGIFDIEQKKQITNITVDNMTCDIAWDPTSGFLITVQKSGAITLYDLYDSKSESSTSLKAPDGDQKKNRWHIMALCSSYVITVPCKGKTMRIWDIRNNSSYTTECEQPILRILAHEKKNSLFVSTEDAYHTYTVPSIKKTNTFDVKGNAYRVHLHPLYKIIIEPLFNQYNTFTGEPAAMLLRNSSDGSICAYVPSLQSLSRDNTSISPNGNILASISDRHNNSIDLHSLSQLTGVIQKLKETKQLFPER